MILMGTLRFLKSLNLFRTMKRLGLSCLRKLLRLRDNRRRDRSRLRDLAASSPLKGCFATSSTAALPIFRGHLVTIARSESLFWVLGCLNWGFRSVHFGPPTVANLGPPWLATVGCFNWGFRGANFGAPNGCQPGPPLVGNRWVSQMGAPGPILGPQRVPIWGPQLAKVVRSVCLCSFSWCLNQPLCCPLDHVCLCTEV